MTQAKLFLIDAMALVYRAHFAFLSNPRINSKNLNTSCILGFTNSLVEMLQKEKPTHIVVVFDTAAPTFRHTLYKPYKQNRNLQPEDISIAIPYIKNVLDAFQIKWLSKDGYEADDIIGTIAKKVANENMIVYMMSPDKDFDQLVDDHILIYKPATKYSKNTIVDKLKVRENWGISQPNQVIDILALQGDNSDNIPGVPGIGPKTAAKLISEYESLENILQNHNTLNDKLKHTFETYQNQAIISKQLATIHTNVPLDFSIEQSIYKGFDKPKLETIFKDLEFNTLAKRIFGSNDKTTQNSINDNTDTSNILNTIKDSNNYQETTDQYEAPIITPSNFYCSAAKYHLIDTPELIQELIEYLKLQTEICLDTETTDINTQEAEIVGISFSYYYQEAYYIPMPFNDIDATKNILYQFKDILENTQSTKIGHNIKYDINVLKKYNINVQGPIFDTMVATHLLAPESRNNLNTAANLYLNYLPIRIEELIGEKGKDQIKIQQVETNTIKNYASEDADTTLQLKNSLHPKLIEENLYQLFQTIEMPLLKILSDMEVTGVYIKTDLLKKMSQELQKDLDALENDIYKMASMQFNINSPKQTGEILFENLNILPKPPKTKTGQYSTNEETLSKIKNNHPIIEKILEYKEIKKLQTTYIEALPNLISKRDNRIHTSYIQTIVNTGRLSSTNPNLQNIPIRTEKGKKIRQAFVAQTDDYLILSADYSQIELRVMAHFSKDTNMIQTLIEDRDIHTMTASKVFNVEEDQVTEEMRRKAKTINFGIIYGISPFGLSQRVNIPRKEAKEIIDAYFNHFPGVKQYMDTAILNASQLGYATTIMGRKKFLPNINSRNQTTKGADERNAINMPIQGSAAEIIKIAMISIHQYIKEMKLQSKMIMQVHDELIFEVHKSETQILQTKIKELMQNAMELSVPLKVNIGIGTDWLAAHK
jgi:DNA polymerase-1